MTDNNNHIVAVVHAGTNTVLSPNETRVVRGDRAVAALNDDVVNIDEGTDRTINELIEGAARTEMLRATTFAMLTNLRRDVQSIVNNIKEEISDNEDFRLDSWDAFEELFAALSEHGINVERPRTEFTASVTVSATFNVSGHTFGDIEDVKDALMTNGDWSHNIDFLTFEDEDLNVDQEGGYLAFNVDSITVREA
jgi:hypothetical protein